ncbi:PIEZ2-like protein [Mya arenaria]|uniref:PIEZ2-like protein n=1 Tax=Mya arenaria TaxID=6604 RepID=A0ABY7EUB7_MYAAR|nr:PIEZ2-like protein [Mya arenaria]
MLCKYWIFLCATMLLVISLQEVVVYRIIYMILFLMFVITFQYAYRFWRLTMKLFWWVVILYSMVVLIILYTYQFENIAKAWRDVTKLPNETLADIGLEQFNTVGLFVRLLTPTTFLILLIIQVHYFHVPFLAISDLDRYKGMPVEGPTTPTVPTSDTQTTIDEGSLDIKEKKSWVKVGDVWEVITWFLWRLAEIHVFKIVAFVVIMVCTHEVSAVSAVYVILLAVFLPMTGCWFLFSHISLLWTALVILSKMIYQLNLVDNTPWLTNCTGNISQEAPFNTTINNAEWVGMKRMDSLGLNFGAYIKNYLGILLIIIFERVIVYHQTQLYNKPGLCYIVTAITICVRVDAYSMLYAIFLGILLLLNRRNNARVWPVYTVILVILLPVQFLLALGVPLGLCYKEDNQVTELEQWLFLPDYEAPPNAYKLVADFFQLLLVCLQWRVFRKELAMRGEMQDGGSNEDILPEVEAKTPIPVKDFTTEVTSYLDIIKNFVFVYMFWVTLAIVFIAGTSRINLFSMGYVIAVFYFMWFEREFLIKPLRRLVRAWNLLLGLCYFIILLKAALQLPGCVYIKIIEDKACWLLWLAVLWQRTTPAYLGMLYVSPSCCFRRESTPATTSDIKIKLKMQSLKKKQASLKKSFVEPDEHFQAIRSGDYYLFEDSEEEEEEPEDEVTTITYGQGRSEDEDEEAGGPSPLQLITTAVTSGTDEAVKKAEEEGGGSKPSSPRPGAKNQGLDEPGTSRQKVGREAVEEEEEEKGGVLAKLKTICSFILAFLSEVGHVEMKETEPRSDGEDLMEVSVQPVTTDVAPLKSEIRTEIMCYFLMILNHILSASLLSLPLPMFAFLWGMLSVPRPTKTFWITVITYTEAVVVVKYLFQFGFFTWNDKVPGSDPFWPPKILGIEQKDNFWVMDLILLLVLFLHRTILKATKEEIAKMEAIRDEERHDSRTSSLQVQPSILRAPSSSSSIEEGVDEPKAEEKDSAFKAVFRPFINFYKQLTCPDYNATTDVYASMFACDFINFLIVVFGYQAFGPSQSAGGDVTSYISEDRVPVPFLIMLLAQFVLIIIDRALYLRKNVLGKFIFQILLVVLLHIWMFFIIPYWTGKPFTSNKPAALWYFIKCVYFYLSAYQIKSAYPTRILGNFLTKKYNYVNLFLFKGFLAIPFLLELRTLMDWIWTNTTMAIGSWLQMEDIYANIYVLKCQRVIEKNHPTPRAQPKAAVIKYGVGGLLLFVVIFIIWFPLVIFSFANTVYIANPPKECTVSVSIAGYQSATMFLNNYKPEDISLIQLDGKSTIIGLYVTFILLIGRMLRLSTTGMAATISFRELPNVDNILRLCLDLYLVREMNEWRLEEDMYAKLLFVYRSAETRVKWTRLRNSQIIEMKKNIIIGLYVSLVLVIGRFVRFFFSDSSFRIMFDELPCVDHILSLCLNLYLARECREYRLEEQLFSKLLFLYRSPEAMIRFTKLKLD